jgi:L-2-hydroxyglutarate oxidase LhgO
MTLAVVEKETRVARHQTGHNSGVIHSGIYYAPGSLKARLCVEGSRLLYAYCDEKRIPYERCGKIIVATEPAEIPRLDELYRRGRANGVVGLAKIDREQLAELEPHVKAVEALHAPETGIVDFKRVATELAADVQRLGGTIQTGTTVTAIAERRREMIVETSDGSLSADFIVTCGGLYSDRLAQMTGASADPRIVPFRGSYYVLRGRATGFVNRLVYPVPDPAFPFLGVHFTKQIDGRVLAGPNAVLAFAREGYRVRDVRPSELWETLSYPGFWHLARKYWRAGAAEVRGELSRRVFVGYLRRLVEDISADDLEPGPSGVRAQAMHRDGRLLDDFWLDESDRVIHVRNAPSPAATSSLALAGMIGATAARRFALD